MDGPIPCTGHKHGNLLITRIARLPVHTARSRASSPVIRKHLHTVRIDLQPQRRGLVDAVIPPLVRSDYELHAATVPHPGLPSLLLHHVLGGAVQFLGSDQCRGLQQRRQSRGPGQTPRTPVTSAAFPKPAAAPLRGAQKHEIPTATIPPRRPAGVFRRLPAGRLRRRGNAASRPRLGRFRRLTAGFQNGIHACT